MHEESSTIAHSPVDEWEGAWESLVMPPANAIVAFASIQDARANIPKCTKKCILPMPSKFHADYIFVSKNCLWHQAKVFIRGRCTGLMWKPFELHKAPKQTQKDAIKAAIKSSCISEKKKEFLMVKGDVAEFKFHVALF